MAGTPFKWNDGMAFGEMCGRGGKVWDPSKYPNNYAEMRNLVTFIQQIEGELKNFEPAEWEVWNKAGKKDDHFFAWALVSAVRGPVVAVV